LNQLVKKKSSIKEENKRKSRKFKEKFTREKREEEIQNRLGEK
jgi:hypothetical protein